MTPSSHQPALLSVQRLVGPVDESFQLKNVNFSLGAGDALVIIGPKGAGKSTLLNLLSCVAPALSGRVVYRGRDILSLAPYRLARLGIAMVGEHCRLLETATVLDNLLLARHAERRTGLLQHVFFPPWVRREEVNHRRRAEEAVDALGLHSVRGEKICNLPVGVRKFVDLGRALVMRPRLVLGDEVTRGLNDKECAAMVSALKNVRRRGASLVLTEEKEGGMAGLANRAAHLEAGELRFAPAREAAPL